jgi:hypothetical protein
MGQAAPRALRDVPAVKGPRGGGLSTTCRRGRAVGQSPPLNPRYPTTRNREILERSRCRAMVDDPSVAGEAREVVDSPREPPLLVCTDKSRSGFFEGSNRVQPGASGVSPLPRPGAPVGRKVSSSVTRTSGRSSTRLPHGRPRRRAGSRRAGPLEYLGGDDRQPDQGLGHRVELEEVEAVLREEASADAVAAGWPRRARAVARRPRRPREASCDRGAPGSERAHGRSDAPTSPCAPGSILVREQLLRNELGYGAVARPVRPEVGWSGRR